MKTCFGFPGALHQPNYSLHRMMACNLLKIFPANAVGPGFVKSVKEVFPDLLYMATGGVNSENMESWFKAGVSVVGIGGGLITNEMVEQENFDLLKMDTGALLKRIAAIRSTPA